MLPERPAWNLLPTTLMRKGINIGLNLKYLLLSLHPHTTESHIHWNAISHSSKFFGHIHRNFGIFCTTAVKCPKISQDGRFSKITKKPGLCTKPEFGSNWSKWYLTGGQYYKIGAFWRRMPTKSRALRLFWSKGPITQPRYIFNESADVTILRNVSKLLFD